MVNQGSWFLAQIARGGVQFLSRSNLSSLRGVIMGYAYTLLTLPLPVVYLFFTYSLPFLYPLFTLEV